MKIASVAEVKARLSAFLNDSPKGPVVITRNGKAVAVLLAVADDAELERLLLANSPKLRAILDAADRRIDQGAGVGHDEFWRQVKATDHTRCIFAHAAGVPRTATAAATAQATLNCWSARAVRSAQ
jgi:prevent-host-death family protein